MLKKVVKNNKGFTLVESLIVVAILVILTAIATKAVSTAVDAYSKVVDSSNAQILLSTTIAEIRDEMGTATDIVVDTTEKTLTYTSSTTGDENCIFNDANDDTTKGIKIKEYLSIETKEQKGKERFLVSESAANKNLACSYASIAYEDGILKLEDINVKRKNSSLVLAHLDSYMVKAG